MFIWLNHRFNRDHECFIHTSASNHKMQACCVYTLLSIDLTKTLWGKNVTIADKQFSVGEWLEGRKQWEKYVWVYIPKDRTIFINKGPESRPCQEAKDMPQEPRRQYIRDIRISLDWFSRKPFSIACLWVLGSFTISQKFILRSIY